MLGVGIIAVALLTLLVILLSLVQSSSKTADLTTSELAADQILNQIFYRQDNFAHTSFWSSAPYTCTGNYKVNQLEFVYSLNATSLPQPNTSEAAASSGIANNTIKLLRLKLTWSNGDDPRQGYGKLHSEVVRIVREQPL